MKLKTKKDGSVSVLTVTAVWRVRLIICLPNVMGMLWLFMCGYQNGVRTLYFKWGISPLRFAWRCVGIANMDYQINEEIRDKEIRLISDSGEQLGVMTTAAAFAIAEEQDLDLVKIAPGSNPPVCKLMDYGKYRFEQAKREKEAKKNQHVIEVKEIRMSPSIGDNDFNVKLRNGQKFLTEGDRLKVTVRFRGREMAHTNLGEILLKRFAEQCTDIASIDKNPKLDGRHMAMFLSPKAQPIAKKEQVKEN